MKGPWQGLRRVLALRLDQLGDVLMTTPALAALRLGLPQAHLTLLTSPAAADAAPHLTMVDEVWTAQVPWMPGSGAATEAALVERLAGGRFDAAVIFTVCTQSALPAALLCRMAGIPLRLAHSRENPYELLTDWARETDDLAHGAVRHEVERQLALVATVGAGATDDRLRFAVHEVDRARMAALLHDEGVADYAVLHPGASAASRRWPADRFGGVARVLASQGITPVFCGGEGDAALLQAAAPPDGALSLAGRLSLGELAALIEGARVLVANNSAPAHLAAAVGTPVVCLYALTNPQHTPWRVASRVLNQDVPCRHCLKSVCPQGHHACLRGVGTPEAAMAALALASAAGSRLDAAITSWKGSAALLHRPVLPLQTEIAKP
jgi:lipopolysaccharide heptosyltransferase II